MLEFDEIENVKFVTENILLIGLALGSGLMLLWPMLKRSAGGVTNVSPGEAVLLINRSNAAVLDVRDDAEFAAGHITDARHIPLSQLDERINELRRFKDRPLLVHCQSGMRSAKASEKLLKHEFRKIYHLQGGIQAWTQAKLPIVKD